MFQGFGGGSNPKKDEPTLPPASNTSNSNKNVQSLHGFDPQAFERAAKAAKELDKSKNATRAVEIVKSEEITKQKQAETERARFKALEQQYAVQRVEEERQAQAKMNENKTQHEKARADYSDGLERRRMVDQIAAQKELQKEERMKAEESLRRQEEIRRKTLEYEAELRQQTEMARAKAEAEGRIKQERQNADIIKDRDSNKAKEFRETILESIKLAGSTIGNGVSEFLNDQQKLQNVAIAGTAIFAGYFATKESAKTFGAVLRARLMKPSLVRETTRSNPITGGIKTLTSPITNMWTGTKTGDALNQVILKPTLADRLGRIAVSTKNTKANRAPFRHLLLHGPPGTGKTMFAKGLATSSGLDYAIMTGGDVAPLGSDAVTEIHKVFDWAKTSKKGVVLFVDEADAFLRKRSTEKISEDMRNALNAFLYRTGEASANFMIVYASNQPDQFDWAINDRIDEIVEFELPGYDERLKMIEQYVDKYLATPQMGAKEIVMEGIDEGILRSTAMKTEGYSGREISKLAIAWQAAAYGTEGAKFDSNLLNKVLEESKLSKQQKRNWLSSEEITNMTSDSK